MTCPNCQGTGELKGPDFFAWCWVCNSTGLVHLKRWEIVKRNLELGARITKQNAMVGPMLKRETL